MQRLIQIYKACLIISLLLLCACGDKYAPESSETRANEDATDALNIIASSSSISLSWQKIEDLHIYVLYRRGKDGVRRMIYRGKENFYEDSGLQSGVMYCYQLEACGKECSIISKTTCSAPRKWQSHGQAPWSARRYPGVVVFKDKIWLFGGEDSTNIHTAYNDIWTFDGDKWKQAAASSPWSPRGEHSAVVFKDKIWILGGLGSGGNVLGDVWVSNDGIDWQLVIAQAPWQARYLHSALVFKNQIWFFAGRKISSEEDNDVWTSEDGKTWKLITHQAPWSEGAYHNFLVFKDRIWMLEGKNYGITTTTRNVWTSQDGKSWIKNIIQGTKHVANSALLP